MMWPPKYKYRKLIHLIVLNKWETTLPNNQYPHFIHADEIAGKGLQYISFLYF